MACCRARSGASSPPVYAPVLREPAPGDGTPPHLAPRRVDRDFLARVPLFADLAAPLRAALAGRAARACGWRAGEMLFEAGDPGDAIYVVRAGRLRDPGAGPARRSSRELGRGASIGELALLSVGPRRHRSAPRAPAT